MTVQYSVCLLLPANNTLASVYTFFLFVVVVFWCYTKVRMSNVSIVYMVILA